MGYALCRQPLTIAHCFKTSDYLRFRGNILLILVPRLVIWLAWSLHVACRGTLGRFWAPGGHKKGHFGVHASICFDLGGFLVPVLKAFQVPRTRKVVSPHGCFQASVSDFLGFESGCMRFENQASGIRGITKTTFLRSCISHDPMSGFGANFHDFCCPGKGFENLMTFYGDSGVIPCAPLGWW